MSTEEYAVDRCRPGQRMERSPQTCTVQEGQKIGQVPLQELTVCPQKAPSSRELRSKALESQCQVPRRQRSLGLRTIFLDQ